MCAYLGFTIWVYTIGTEGHDGNHTLSASASRGKLVFQRNNCQACHQVYGLGGFMGPDLTNSIEKSEAYVKAMIEYGSDRMPKFDLSAQEISDVTEYLSYVNQTGHSPLKNFRLTPYGTVKVLRSDTAN